MSKRSIVLLLEDMLEAASKIVVYNEGLDFERFVGDQKTVDATIRNFEIIGEVANRVDSNFKLKYSEISWNRLAGFRNRLIQ